jgi:hypothetical protein
MRKYTIQLNYNASIIVEVEVEDGNDAEGRALDKARDKAEDADIRQFTIGSENESKILRAD